MNYDLQERVELGAHFLDKNVQGWFNNLAASAEGFSLLPDDEELHLLCQVTETSEFAEALDALNLTYVNEEEDGKGNVGVYGFDLVGEYTEGVTPDEKLGYAQLKECWLEAIYDRRRKDVESEVKDAEDALERRDRDEDPQDEEEVLVAGDPGDETEPSDVDEAAEASAVEILEDDLAGVKLSNGSIAITQEQYEEYKQLKELHSGYENNIASDDSVGGIPVELADGNFVLIDSDTYDELVAIRDVINEPALAEDGVESWAVTIDDMEYMIVDDNEYSRLVELSDMGKEMDKIYDSGEDTTEGVSVEYNFNAFRIFAEEDVENLEELKEIGKVLDEADLTDGKTVDIEHDCTVYTVVDADEYSKFDELKEMSKSFENAGFNDKNPWGVEFEWDGSNYVAIEPDDYQRLQDFVAKEEVAEDAQELVPAVAPGVRPRNRNA